MQDNPVPASLLGAVKRAVGLPKEVGKRALLPPRGDTNANGNVC
jgi:hypothetical protein